jgi:hypothetical protein
MAKVIAKGAVEALPRPARRRQGAVPANGGHPEARTPLGRKLLRLRASIVRSGERMLSAEEIRRELSRQWGS